MSASAAAQYQTLLNSPHSPHCSNLKMSFIVSGYSTGFSVLDYDESTGKVELRPGALLGGEEASFLGYTTFDDRTGNLYAVQEFEGEFGRPHDVAATLSRWSVTAGCKSVNRQQVRYYPALGAVYTNTISRTICCKSDGNTCTIRK
jgi:hypothetical protein